MILKILLKFKNLKSNINFNTSWIKHHHLIWLAYSLSSNFSALPVIWSFTNAFFVVIAFRSFSHESSFSFLTSMFRRNLTAIFQALENLRWLWTPPTFFSNFAKNSFLSCLSNVDNIKEIHGAVFKLQAPKAVIKGVFHRSDCCYGYLLSYENDTNIFTNGWAVIWYQDRSINW